MISDNEEKFYLGCCESEFKLRFNNHTQSFKSKTHMHDTQLSKYVWSLKETKTDFNIVWSIAAKASPYACGTRKCDLCLTEKLLIAKSDPGKMLNSRAEIFSKCRHQNKFKLKCFKTWPYLNLIICHNLLSCLTIHRIISYLMFSCNPPDERVTAWNRL